LSKDGLAVGAKIFSSLDKASRHADFRLFQVGARIVDLLVANLAIDFKHTFDVFTEVGDDRAGESVLGVGINVHLDDAVLQSLADIAEFGTGAPVENEIHQSSFTVFVSHSLLSITKDGWLELNRPWLVGTMNIAKSGGKEKAANWLKGFVTCIMSSGVV